MELKELLAEDQRHKPVGADLEWQNQSLAYDDQNRHKVQEFLAALKIGIEDNGFPLEFNLLRRVVNRLAVVYDSPATRWLLKGDGSRVSEKSGEHREMIEALERAQYDQAWKNIDRRRSLHRTVAVRFAASDARRSVTLRTFEPFNVHRAPSLGDADLIQADRAFALRMGSREDPVYEIWERNGPPGAPGTTWTVRRENKSGQHVEQPPYPDGVSPYGSLPPVMLVFDQYPDGLAWLPPRHSRTAFPMALAAQVNDLWSLIMNQAHDETYVKARDPDRVPEEHGHTVRPVLDQDDSIESVVRDPKIDACREVILELVRLMVATEDLPTEEFMRGRQVVTGAALEALERPLMERREDQIPLARADERMAWRHFVTVHNVHAERWEVPLLPRRDLAVDIARPNLPQDKRQLEDSILRRTASGMGSTILGIQEIYGVSRSRAIEMYEQFKEDNKAYPAPTPQAEGAPDIEGPQPTGQTGEPNMGSSVIQNLRAVQTT